jgi:hypothetical protein
MAGGRPKGSTNSGCLEGRVAAKRHADKAMKTLVAIMEDGAAPAAARVTAAENILCRAYGKAPQSFELTGADGGPIEHSVTNDAEYFTGRIFGLIAKSSEGASAEGSQH